MVQRRVTLFGRSASKRDEKMLAVFTYSGRFLTKRKASDGAADHEGMASAIADEHEGPSDTFAAGRKLLEYRSKTARISEHSQNVTLSRRILNHDELIALLAAA